MLRFVTLLVLAFSFISINIIAQRDSGKDPVKGREPGDRTGGGDRTAIAQPLPPRDNSGGSDSGDREHPVGHPQRSDPRPSPPQQERPAPQPVYSPEPDVIYVEVPVYDDYVCYDCTINDPVRPLPPYPILEPEEASLKMQAIDAFNDKNYLNALVLLTDAINEIPYDYELYFYRGVTNVKLENYLWAIEDLDLYLKHHPENKVAWYYRGLAHYYTYNDENAYDDLDFARQLGEPRAKIFLSRYF